MDPSGRYTLSTDVVGFSGGDYAVQREGKVSGSRNIVSLGERKLYSVLYFFYVSIHPLILAIR